MVRNQSPAHNLKNMKLYLTAESLIGLTVSPDPEREFLLSTVTDFLESGGRLYTSWHSLSAAVLYIEKKSENPPEGRGNAALFLKFIQPLFSEIFSVTARTFSDALHTSHEIPLSYALDLSSARENDIHRVAFWADGVRLMPGFIFIPLKEIGNSGFRGIIR